VSNEKQLEQRWAQLVEEAQMRAFWDDEIRALFYETITGIDPMTLSVEEMQAVTDTSEFKEQYGRLIVLVSSFGSLLTSELLAVFLPEPNAINVMQEIKNMRQEKEQRFSQSE